MTRTQPKTGSGSNLTSELSRLGGYARAKSMTAEQRRASAQKAINARWAAYREAKEKNASAPRT